MLKSIQLMIAKREAEILMVEMDVNDPFHSAYSDFLSGVDEWIAFYEKLEG